jgi:adenosylmethionine-8-amino-7-oxononanoate aminotransferase
MQTSTRSNLPLERSLAAVWHPARRYSTRPCRSFPWRAEPVAGSTITTAGATRCDQLVGEPFGHCNRHNAALTDQLGKLEHVLFAGFSHEPVVEL